MFNLKKNLFLEGKMQSLCSGKCNPYVRENISGHWFF